MGIDQKTPKKSWSIDALYNPLTAEGHPLEAFLIGLCYSVIAVGLSIIIFQNEASTVMVAITVIATLPLVYNIIQHEAIKKNVCATERCRISGHRKAVKALTFLFLGFLLGYVIWFLSLSQENISHVFNSQLNTILTVHPSIGHFSQTTGTLLSILLNNLRIVALCFIFSVLFGEGALYILAWNASVMATAIGTAFKQGISITGGGGALYVTYIALARYLTHGIFEIVAFFLAGLAGGILYHTAIRKKLDKGALTDIVTITLIAVVLIVIGAFIEVYITPKII